MTYPLIFSLVAAGILTPLACYAFHLLRKVNARRRQLEHARRQRLNHLTQSMDIIAKAMQNGDCNPSEGVIRLSMLLMPLGETLADYPAMNALYQTVKDMPIQDARQALPKKERMRLDLQRESREAELETAILAELPSFIEKIAGFGEKTGRNK